VVIVTGASHGATSVNTTTGSVTYTPNPGFSGMDEFMYTVSDNFGETSNAATVTIQVTPPIYTPPVANNDITTTTGNTLVVINVLANDTDPNPGGILNPASVFVMSAPSNGSTTLNTTTGAITYTPKSGFTGTDQFKYTVSDNFGLTSLPATVTIVVAASPPIAKNIEVVTPVNTPVLIGILANVTDPNPAGVLIPASVLVVSGPIDGPPPSLNTTTGALTYTPNPGFSGTDEFMYTVSDNFGLTSIPAMVTIQVTSAITAAGMRFNVYPGLPLNNIPIATFTDLNLFTPPAKPSGYSATIDWGNGQTSSGAVSGPNPSGVFTVTTSFTYPTGSASQFVPGTAFPVTVTITDSNGDVGTANSSAVLVSTGQNVVFTASLAATPGNGPDAANGITDTNEPTFSGTAPPFSIVQLYASRALPAPAIAPPVTADAAGYWSVVDETLLPAGTNTIYGTVTIPATFQSGPVLLTSITVTTPAQTLNIQPTLMISGELTVVFLGVTSSTNTSSLPRRNDYTLSGPGLTDFHPKSASPVASSRLRAGEMEVVLKLSLPRRMLRKIKILKFAGTDHVLGD
jgi:large repetitive protein